MNAEGRESAELADITNEKHRPMEILLRKSHRDIQQKFFSMTRPVPFVMTPESYRVVGERRTVRCVLSLLCPFFLPLARYKGQFPGYLYGPPSTSILPSFAKWGGHIRWMCLHVLTLRPFKPNLPDDFAKVGNIYLSERGENAWMFVLEL